MDRLLDPVVASPILTRGPCALKYNTIHPPPATPYTPHPNLPASPLPLAFAPWPFAASTPHPPPPPSLLPLAGPKKSPPFQFATDSWWVDGSDPSPLLLTCELQLPQHIFCVAVQCVLQGSARFGSILLVSACGNSAKWYLTSSTKLSPPQFFWPHFATPPPPLHPRSSPSICVVAHAVLRNS